MDGAFFLFMPPYVLTLIFSPSKPTTRFNCCYTHKPVHVSLLTRHHTFAFPFLILKAKLDTPEHLFVAI
jgi:hypothetical protein